MLYLAACEYFLLVFAVVIPHPRRAEALSDDARLPSVSDVCLSVVYIGNNSRTERPRKTKIGTQVAHVTRDSDTTLTCRGMGIL